MVVLRSDERQVNTLYSEAQVESVLSEIGIDVTDNDGDWIRCYCPFHNNNDSPAMGVQVDFGKFHCFNPSCDERGDLIDLVQRMTGKNRFESIRMVRSKSTGEVDLEAKLLKTFKESKGLTRYDKVDFNKMHEEYYLHEVPQEYMKSRGFERETIDRFNFGYSEKQNAIMVPVHDHTGLPVGFLARLIHDKQFHISKGLKKSLLVYNLNRARRVGGNYLILTEASFDTARVDQAGFKNVGALLGGSIGDVQTDLIKKHYRGVIIMTDDDPLSYPKDCKKCPRAGYKVCIGHNAGRQLGREIEKKMRGMSVRWASYEYGKIYPDGCKDVGDMTDRQIAQCIENAVPTFQYNMWDLHPQVDVWYN